MTVFNGLIKFSHESEKTTDLWVAYYPYQLEHIIRVRLSNNLGVPTCTNFPVTVDEKAIYWKQNGVNNLAPIEEIYNVPQDITVGM